MEQPKCNLLLASNKWLITIENDPISDSPTKKLFIEYCILETVTSTQTEYICVVKHMFVFEMCMRSH